MTSCGVDSSSFWHTPGNFRDGGFEFRRDALAMNTYAHGYSISGDAARLSRSSSLKTVFERASSSRDDSSCEADTAALFCPASIYPVQVNYYERTPRSCARKTIPGVAPEHLRSPRKSLCFSLRPPRQTISLVGQNFLSVEIGNTKCIVGMHNASQ
ncbi:unnamed protein product [Lasius platythorax]|uniref:Uncharacterized protein n=1 Tax=Lasius platythorax TaxID=488582 RepID=A0AAV2NDL1_9HYME